jgi:HSP20 family protein
MSLILKNRSLLPELNTDFFETGRLFPNFFDTNGDLINWEKNFIVPDVNIAETEKEFKLELAVPGMDKKDIKVEFQNGILKISGERKEEKKEEKKNYKRREFSYDKFSRSFTMPDNSLPDKIDAKYENGVLNITIPKKEIAVTKAKKEITVS